MFTMAFHRITFRCIVTIGLILILLFYHFCATNEYGLQVQNAIKKNYMTFETEKQEIVKMTTTNFKEDPIKFNETNFNAKVLATTMEGNIHSKRTKLLKP